MVERFFSVKQSNAHQQNNNPDPITLLSGPPCCGKTSLLFQFAFNTALEGNTRDVVFICSRQRFETKPPFLSQSVNPSSDVFQHVKMKYVDDAEGMKKYFAAFHLHDRFPTAVVIDDFGLLFDERICQERYASPRGRDIAMVGALALCHNAIAHANERETCRLLLSDTHHGDTLRLLYIYKRWVSSIFTIKGDGSGFFLLKRRNYLDNVKSEKSRAAKYSVALQYLNLESVIEDSEQ